MRRLLLLFPLLSLCSTACESDGRELFTNLSVRFIARRPSGRTNRAPLRHLLLREHQHEGTGLLHRPRRTVGDPHAAKGGLHPHRRGQPALHRRNGAIRPQRRPQHPVRSARLDGRPECDRIVVKIRQLTMKPLRLLLFCLLPLPLWSEAQTAAVARLARAYSAVRSSTTPRSRRWMLRPTKVLPRRCFTAIRSRTPR